MAGLNGRSFSQWAWQALLLASTVSALSFHSIEPHTGPALPLGCILAYSSDIPGCRISDFSRPGVCSPACVTGLRRVVDTLQAACGDVTVRPTSVLGQALLGNVLELLCPGTVSNPTTLLTRTSVAPPVATTDGLLSFTTFRLPTTTTTTTSAEETETEEPSRASTASSASDSSTTSTAQPDTPIPTAVLPPTSTAEPSAPPAETAGPTSDDDVGRMSGGGSPFDIASSDSPRVTARWTTALTAALGLLLLLR